VTPFGFALVYSSEAALRVTQILFCWLWEKEFVSLSAARTDDGRDERSRRLFHAGSWLQACPSDPFDFALADAEHLRSIIALILRPFFNHKSEIRNVL
jgi:hypothetical protein